MDDSHRGKFPQKRESSIDAVNMRPMEQQGEGFSVDESQERQQSYEASSSPLIPLTPWPCVITTPAPARPGSHLTGLHPTWQDRGPISISRKGREEHQTRTSPPHPRAGFDGRMDGWVEGWPFLLSVHSSSSG